MRVGELLRFLHTDFWNARLNYDPSMPQDAALTRTTLKTPKAAAIAGIIFSVLFVFVFWLFRRAVPADPLEPGTWLANDIKSAELALDIIPFASVAFLWFIGVLRDHLGELEDRFFATVFFGSGLLFLAMFFASAAMIGAVILVHSGGMINSAAFQVVRALAFIVMNTYALKMAGVFMFSTSMVINHTGIAPRWIAVTGYVLALLLIVGSSYVSWSVVVFPIWVFLLSAHILLVNMRRPAAGPA
jgi:hypothetical protein